MDAEMVKVSISRCPHCSALLTRGADWCSLCLTDLRPAPEPAQVATGVLERDAGADVGLDEVPESANVLAATVPAGSRARGKHARQSAAGALDQQSAAAESGLATSTGLAASLASIREATAWAPESGADAERDPGDALDLDAIDMSVLAGAGSTSIIDAWTLKAQAPGAKIGLMVAGVTVVGGVALLVLTIAGLVLR